MAAPLRAVLKLAGGWVVGSWMMAARLGEWLKHAGRGCRTGGCSARGCAEARWLGGPLKGEVLATRKFGGRILKRSIGRGLVAGRLIGSETVWSCECQRASARFEEILLPPPSGGGHRHPLTFEARFSVLPDPGFSRMHTRRDQQRGSRPTLDARPEACFRSIAPAGWEAGLDLSRSALGCAGKSVGHGVHFVFRGVGRPSHSGGTVVVDRKHCGRRSCAGGSSRCESHG